MDLDVKKLLDKDYDETITLYGKDNVQIEVKRIAIVTFDKKNIYIIFKPISPNFDFDEDEVLIYEYINDEKSMKLVTDENLEQKIIDEYNKEM